MRQYFFLGGAPICAKKRAWEKEKEIYEAFACPSNDRASWLGV
jgi:hypothetical protein